MKFFLQITLLLIVLLRFNPLHAQQPPSIEWEKCLGGLSEEVAYCVQQTTDGGFIVVGDANSNDGDIIGHHGGVGYSDAWVIKLDSGGNILWQNCLGGSNGESATSIRQTTDGGYIVGGYGNSTDGDVTGNHGMDDYWIVKVDSLGDLIWQKSLGGTGEEVVWSIEQITDGGYIVCGYSASDDGDITGHHGLASHYDYWIVKLDPAGNLAWQKSLGGNLDDYAYSVDQTHDGGFIVAGYSSSTDGDVSGQHGGWDYWIVKLDSAGNLKWQKCLGGSGQDKGFSVEKTIEGGFIVAGYSNSVNGDVSGNLGGTDNWLVKLDSVGNIIWQKCFGGTLNEGANSVQQTPDSGFVFTGWVESNDDDVTGNNGGPDYWLVKLNGSGNLIWQKCLGGTQAEYPFTVQQTSDGGFAIAGSSNSIDGDVTGLHNVYGIWADCWVVKLSNDMPTGVPLSSRNFISIFPNPVQTQLTLVLHGFSVGGIGVAVPSNEITILVCDLHGRIITLPSSNFIPVAWDQTSNSLQLNTTSLPDGFYTLQIINRKSGVSEVIKFVKAE